MYLKVDTVSVVPARRLRWQYAAGVCARRSFCGLIINENINLDMIQDENAVAYAYSNHIHV